MQNFRTYDLALEFHTLVTNELKIKKLKGNIKDQLERALLSIPLNLTEGASRTSLKERKRFYTIALGSFREVHCLIKITGMANLEAQADKLGAHLYRLSHPD